MAYELAKLDDAAADHLMRSVREFEEVFRDFADAKSRGWLPSGWARDPVADSFLISLPCFLGCVSWERCYCFYFEGAPYKVRFLTPFGCDAQLIAPGGHMPVMPHKINEVLTAAFAVHEQGITVKDGRLMAIGGAVVPLLRLEP